MPRQQQSTPEKLADSAEFLALVEGWDPKTRETHCSNCLHAVVTGDGVHVPTVSCEEGYGAERSFWQLTRAFKPFAFRVAADCPDFASMSDD